ncbi:21644_t:CDS:1, partial [Dentiscutata erythropus]
DWKRYNPNEHFWELAENVINIQEAIQKFYQQYLSKPKPHFAKKNKDRKPKRNGLEEEIMLRSKPLTHDQPSLEFVICKMAHDLSPELPSL